jgi:hypothetical protein
LTFFVSRRQKKGTRDDAKGKRLNAVIMARAFAVPFLP